MTCTDCGDLIALPDGMTHSEWDCIARLKEKLAAANERADREAEARDEDLRAAHGRFEALSAALATERAAREEAAALLDREDVPRTVGVTALPGEVPDDSIATRIAWLMRRWREATMIDADEVKPENLRQWVQDLADGRDRERAAREKAERSAAFYKSQWEVRGQYLDGVCKALDYGPGYEGLAIEAASIAEAREKAEREAGEAVKRADDTAAVLRKFIDADRSLYHIVDDIAAVYVPSAVIDEAIAALDAARGR